MENENKNVNEVLDEKKEEKVEKENSKSGRKTGIIIGVTTLLILGIIIVGMMFIRKNIDSGNNGVNGDEEDKIFRIDPIKNPQVTYYNFRGEVYPDWAKFGLEVMEREDIKELIFLHCQEQMFMLCWMVKLWICMLIKQVMD